MDHSVGGSSIMSREEFEARKAELRRKRELEQRSQKRYLFFLVVFVEVCHRLLFYAELDEHLILPEMLALHLFFKLFLVSEKIN